jgi:hypothetical protein
MRTQTRREGFPLLDRRPSAEVAGSGDDPQISPVCAVVSLRLAPGVTLRLALAGVRAAMATDTRRT